MISAFPIDCSRTRTHSLTINLHLMMATFYRPVGMRDKVLIEEGAFSSDRHAVLGQLGWHKLDAEGSLVEIAPRSSGPAERRLREEGERLLGAAPAGAILVALDETGRQLDSAGLARRIARWQEQGHRSLVFAIGGPDGLARSVLDRAEATMAFGRMTWPHRLVRVMLAEQLYRAGTILSGHPYHRA